MIDVTKDIQPFTTFRNNSVKMMKQLRKSQRPIVLTVNGKPAAVVQSPEEYQRLMNIAAKASEAEGVRQGLEDVVNGRTTPARRSFDQARKKFAIPG